MGRYVGVYGGYGESVCVCVSLCVCVYVWTVVKIVVPLGTQNLGRRFILDPKRDHTFEKTSLCGEARLGKPYVKQNAHASIAC